MRTAPSRHHLLPLALLGLLGGGRASAQDSGAPPPVVPVTAPTPRGEPTAPSTPAAPAPRDDLSGPSAPGAPALSQPPTGKARADLSDDPRAMLPGREPGDPFIAVDDPMLTPVPAAEQVLARWQDALSMVRAQNPNLNRAYAQIQVAEGQQRQAAARYLPTLRSTGTADWAILTGEGFNINTFTEGTIPDPRGSFTTDLTLRVPLLNARAWYDHGTAGHGVRQAELAAKDVERLVIGGLAEAVVAVVTAERLSAVTRVNLAATLSTLELNKKRAALGAANAVDVLRAEQEVATSRRQVIEADENLRQSRERLGLSLGRAEPWGVTPEISLDQLRKDAAATCQLGETIDDRPDIQTVEKGRDIAERNVKSVDFAFLPTVDLTTRASYHSITFRQPNDEHIAWSLGGLFTWDLYDGGLRYGQKQTTKGLLAVSDQDVAARRQAAEIEVGRALRGVSVAQATLEVSRSTRDIASQNARLARVRFVNGTGSSFDMIQTQNAAQQAAIDVTVKEFQLLRAQIAAFLALASCDI